MSKEILNVYRHPNFCLSVNLPGEGNLLDNWTHNGERVWKRFNRITKTFKGDANPWKGYSLIVGPFLIYLVWKP